MYSEKERVWKSQRSNVVTFSNDILLGWLPPDVGASYHSLERQTFLRQHCNTPCRAAIITMPIPVSNPSLYVDMQLMLHAVNTSSSHVPVPICTPSIKSTPPSWPPWHPFVHVFSWQPPVQTQCPKRNPTI